MLYSLLFDRIYLYIVWFFGARRIFARIDPDVDHRGAAQLVHRTRAPPRLSAGAICAGIAPPSSP